MKAFARVSMGPAAFAAIVVLLAIVPLTMPPFWVTLGNYIGLYSIVALGLVLLTGVAGQTSFGQAAFVGIGAYVTAYLSTHVETLSWLPWLNLVVGLALTALIALALGFITLRMRGHYLPLATIAWGISLYYLFGNLEFLGGHTGMTGIPALSVAGFELRNERYFCYLIWVMALSALSMAHYVLDSRPGRAIRALRGGLDMAEAFGVNTGRLKIIVFVYAALLACVSGWLYAHLQRFVNPTPFGLNQGIEYLFMAVVGGAGSVWGAVVGAALVTLLKTQLQDWLPSLIGPNGAGKSTMFNLIGGALPMTRGAIAFDGKRIAGQDPYVIAGLGIARTFQHVRLLSEMSVLDNVAFGAYLRGSAGFVRAALRLDRREEARAMREAALQIGRVGLAAHLHAPAGSLPLGQQDRKSVV